MEPRLFVAIYSDEDVTPKLARALRAQGYDAQSYLDVGMIAKEDDMHFAYAIQHECAILTNNAKHFDKMAGNWVRHSNHHYGVIIATQKMSFSELLQRTLAFLDAVSADEAIDRTFYLSNFG